ncbi:MAG TPA: electron transfer flavoprotein subunit beta/FixA family protein [Nitrososphaerales archaeon]|nr:electron transfer flavoprotein subunit beta/FixA family protein [Nitrososphaerales archaeon]
MRFAVCVKHAIDETELRIDSSGKPQVDGAVGKMSTFDKNAVEEALRLRSAKSGEVVAFTVGGPDARKTLKEALAMGADRGVIVSADLLATDTLRTAELLAAAITKTGPYDVVLCSEGSSDTYDGQVPPMLGELLGLPYAGYSRKIELDGGSAKVERSLEDMLEVVETSLPFVASVVSEINEPRYPTLIQIMQSSKKQVGELNGEQLVQLGKRRQSTIVSMSAQSSARKHVMIEGSPDQAAAELLEALIKEGVLPK